MGCHGDGVQLLRLHCPGSRSGFLPFIDDCYQEMNVLSEVGTEGCGLRVWGCGLMHAAVGVA